MGPSSVTLCGPAVLADAGQEEQRGCWKHGRNSCRGRLKTLRGFESLRGRNEFQRTQRCKSPFKGEGASELDYLNVQI